MKRTSRTYQPDTQALSDRERQILRLVVKSFIDTVGPVGSRFLARQYPLGLSPASIRNTMSDLEAQGYLGHPHTSAGRVPTELGYRTFVDELMQSAALTPAEKRLVRGHLEGLLGDTDQLLRESSRLLGELTSLLGVVLSPRLSTGILERLEVVPVSSDRLMFIISVRGGLIRTIVLQVASALNRRDLDRVVAILNERLVGLTLEEIRQTCRQRVADIDDRETGIVRLTLNASATLFSEEPTSRQVALGGTPHMLQQPEFQQTDDVRELITLLENRDALVRLIEADGGGVTPPGKPTATVRIGSENEQTQVEDASVDRYSIVTAQYRVGQAVGTIGVIGPTRMDYARVVTLVETMARQISQDNPN